MESRKPNARLPQEGAARVVARVLAGAGVAKGRMGKELAVGKVVRCSCGVEMRGRTEDELIRRVQAHARDVHDLALSEEQVRAMMEIDQ
jgi:predicted small metal-binding protein